MRWTHTDAKTMCDRNGGHAWVDETKTSTVIVKGEEGDYHMEYCGSPLVTYHPDGTFTLRHCGYKTKTTKRRLSQFGPCDVFQRDNVWYLHTIEGPIPFVDGMRVDAWGEPCPFGPTVELDWSEHEMEATVDNQIRKEFF